MVQLLLTLRYDGTNYHGWQVQSNALAVQPVVQDAIERVTGIRSGLTGCSRTDTGVHAEMYCCAFRTECPLRGRRMTAALNAWLPRDIAVYDCREVPDTFHPRYSAVGKRYVYRIWNAPDRHPFWEGRALHLRGSLDVAQMDRAAQDFLGSHDFAACRSADPARRGKNEDTVRTVSHVSVTAGDTDSGGGRLVEFSVQADGFLYNMVRIMTGTLLDMAVGRLPWEAISVGLESGERAAMGATAPAKGLYLQRVVYPSDAWGGSGK